MDSRQNIANPERETKHDEFSTSEVLRLEYLKQKFGLYKVVAGTAVVGVVTAALPFIIEYSKVSLDTEVSRRDFVAEYVDMVEADPNGRIALVEYFSYVLPDDSQRKLWIDYRERLEALQKAAEAKQLEKDRLLAEGGKDDSLQIRQIQSELERIKQRLQPVARPASSMFFRGTANNWSRTPMTLGADDFWEITVAFAGEESPRFKFDMLGDWSENFGDSNGDGIADLSGPDIAITEGTGLYKIRFNYKTKEYTVTKLSKPKSNTE